MPQQAKRKLASTHTDMTQLFYIQVLCIVIQFIALHNCLSLPCLSTK